MDSRKRLYCAALALALGLVAAPAAPAAQELYPPADGEQSLNGGPAGYTASTDSRGPCVSLSLCPTVINEHRPDGGVRNSGHLRTSLSSLAGVEAVSIGRWTGPAFVYRGVAGEEPDNLRLRISRRAEVSTLLAVEGNSATYSVDLVPTDGGAAVSAIERESLAGAEDFVERSAGVDTASMKLGQSYRIRITTRYETGAQVFPGASADYDDVSLLARRADPTAGNDGEDGDDGRPGGGGGGALDPGGKPSLAKSVVLRGSKLLVKVRCARRPKSRCKPRIDARLSRKGPQATNKRVARVPAGKTRRVALDVRRRHRTELASRKRIVLRMRAKVVGERRAETTYKRVRVRIKRA